MGGNDYFNPDPNSAPQPQLDPRRAGPPEMMYMAPPLPGAVGPNGGSPMYEDTMDKEVKILKD